MNDESLSEHRDLDRDVSDTHLVYWKLHSPLQIRRCAQEGCCKSEFKDVPKYASVHTHLCTLQQTHSLYDPAWIPQQTGCHTSKIRLCD